MIDRVRLKFLIQNVEGQFNKDCITYFTKETDKTKLKLAENQVLQQLVDNFNLNDIPFSNILDEADEIKKRPDVTLPRILKFDEKIDNSYFIFLIKLTKPGFNRSFITENISEIYTHLYRFIVCLNYQIDDCILPISKGLDTSSIPSIFSMSFLGLIRLIMILPKEYLPSFTMVIKMIFRKLIEQLNIVLSSDPSESFIEEILSVCSALSALISSNLLTPEENLEFISISLDVYNMFIKYKKFDEKTFPFLVNFTSIVLQFFTVKKIKLDSISESIITMAILFFSQINNFPNDESHRSISIALLKIINSLSDCIKKDVKQLSQAFAIFITWLQKWNLKFKKLEIQETKSCIFSSTLDPSKFQIIDTVTIDKQLINEYVSLPKEYPPFEMNFTGVLQKCIKLLLETLNKNKQFMIEFFKCTFRSLSVSSNPELQYLLINLLLSLENDKLRAVIDESGSECWKNMFNDFLFSLITVKEEEDNEYGKLFELSMRFAEKAFCTGSSNLDQLLVVICQYIRNDSPTRVKEIVKLLFRLSKKCTESFYKALNNIQSGPMLIQIDLIYINQIINSHALLDDLIFTHTTIVSILTELAKYKEFDDDVFDSTICIDYVLSLTLEKGLEHISSQILRNIIKVTENEQIFEKCANFITFIAEQDARYINSFITVLESFRTGIIGANKVLIKYFAEHGIIGIISKTIKQLSSLDLEKYQRFSTITVALNVFMMFCQSSNDNLIYFAQCQDDFVDSFSFAISKVDVNEALADVLISLCLNEMTSFQIETRARTLRNTPALWLLYNTTLKCQLSDRIFAYLLAIVTSSVENCWHCYICGFLLHLINDLNDSTPHIIFELINAIGSRFFGTAELTAIFQQMKRTECAFSTQLVETVYNMLKTRIKFPISTGFYVENETKRYFTPSFSSLDSFKLTFTCTPKKQGTFGVLRISSPKESITFYTGTQLCLRFKSESHVQENSFVHRNNMNTDGYNLVSFTLHSNEVSVSLNDVQMEEISNFAFSFTSDPISFELLDREKALPMCENISITDIKTKSSYAIIFDHSVPFPLSFNDVLPLAGGPQIFLPFLEIIEKSSSQQKVFLKYVQIIGLAIKDEESQASPSFFRAFGHLLKKIPLDVWSDAAVNEIKTIALRLSQPRLIVAMLQHILLDFVFWDNFSKHSKLTILQRTIIPIKNENTDLFVSSIDYDMLLIQIFRLFERGNSTCLISSCLELLNAYTTVSVNSALAMLYLGMKTSDYQDEALMIIFSHINSNSASFLSVLEKYDYYKPFLQLVLQENEKTMFWALYIIFIIVKNIPKEKIPAFSHHLISTARSFTRTIPPDSFLTSILGFAFDKIKIFNNSTPMCSVQPGNSYTIKYPEFFILFVCIAIISNVRSKVCGELLLDVFRHSKASRDSIKTLDHWMFWILVFFSLFSTPEEYGKTFALFAIDDGTNHDFYPYYSFIMLACARLNWDWNVVAGIFVLEIIQNVQCDESYKLCFLFLCLPHHLITEETIDMHSPSLDIDYLMNLFYKPLSSTISFVFKSSCNSWETTHAKEIFNVFIQNAMHNTKSLTKQIKFDSMNSISLINIVVLLLDTYQNAEDSGANQFISEFATYVESLKEVDKSLISACLFLLTLDIKESDKVRLKESLIRSGKQSEQIDDIASKTKTALIQLFEATIPDFQVSITKLFDDLLYKGIIDFTRERLNTNMQHLQSESQNVFLELSKQEDTREAQLERQNAKVWNKLLKSLKEDGGAWSVIEPEPHWKLDQKIDILGRHYRLKKNRHFDMHEEASKQRDSGFKVPPKSNGDPFKLLAPKDIELDNAPFFHSDCQMNTITSLYKGSIHLYKDNIVFESTAIFASCDGVPSDSDVVFKNSVYEIDINDIKYVLNRRYMHKDNACEIFTKKMISYFFIFPEGVRDKVYTRLSHMNNIYVQKGSSAKVLKDFKVIERWQSGNCSNYQYLYMLNIICGRSYNDLNQYPVFPWVISNYKSKTIDLKDPKNYRDLSKPMGSFDKSRLENLLIGFNEVDDPTMKCMYRVFYSNPAHTIGFMIRMEPFTSLHIKLQSGQFDIAGRIFSSVSEAWESALHESGDFRELIPEFYSLPEFLENQNHFDLGYIKTTKKKVDDVELPPWAESASHFIHINRMALESPYVSSTLNQWVDLIFGFKQRGIEAEKALNVFHPFSYPSIIEQTEIMNMFGEAINSHSLNFGVVPSMAFSEPSPSRGNFITAHTFDVLFSTKLFATNYQASNVWIQNSTILTTTIDGRVISSRLSKNEIKVKRSTHFPTKFLSCFNAKNDISKHFLIIARKYAVLVPPTANSFTLFNIRSENAAIINESQPHPGTINAVSADINNDGGTTELFVASAASDSSLFIYDYIINDRSIQYTRISSMVHKSSIIDVALSYTFDLVASIDKTTLAFSSLKTGKLIVLTALDVVPSKVVITEVGYVIVLSIIEENGEKATRIDVYDSMCQKINYKVRLGECTAMTIYTDPNLEEYAIFSFSDNTYAVMSTFELITVVQGELPQKCISIASSKELDCAIFCLDDGTIRVHPFNRVEFDRMISSK